MKPHEVTDLLCVLVPASVAAIALDLPPYALVATVIAAAFGYYLGIYRGKRANSQKH